MFYPFKAVRLRLWFAHCGITKIGLCSLCLERAFGLRLLERLIETFASFEILLVCLRMGQTGPHTGAGERV